MVAKNAPLVVIEAMKMELTLGAPLDGTVAQVRHAVDDMVEQGTELVTFAAEAHASRAKVARGEARSELRVREDALGEIGHGRRRASPVLSAAPRRAHGDQAALSRAGQELPARSRA